MAALRDRVAMVPLQATRDFLMRYWWAAAGEDRVGEALWNGWGLWERTVGSDSKFLQHRVINFITFSASGLDRKDCKRMCAASTPPSALARIPATHLKGIRHVCGTHWAQTHWAHVRTVTCFSVDHFPMAEENCHWLSDALGGLWTKAVLFLRHMPDQSLATDATGCSATLVACQGSGHFCFFGVFCLCFVYAVWCLMCCAALDASLFCGAQQVKNGPSRCRCGTKELPPKLATAQHLDAGLQLFLMLFIAFWWDGRSAKLKPHGGTESFKELVARCYWRLGHAYQKDCSAKKGLLLVDLSDNCWYSTVSIQHMILLWESMG